MLNELVQHIQESSQQDILSNKKLIDLRISERNLVKQELFVEAQQVKDIISSIEKELVKKSEEEKEKTIIKKTKQLSQKQDIDITHFQDKTEKEIIMINKQNQEELELFRI